MFETRFVRAMALALIAALPALATAQSADKEALRRAVGASLTAVLGGDSARAVVDKIATVKPDGAISKNFNAAEMSKQWFGARTPPNPAPDCRATQTASGEPDEGLCMLEVGRREGDATGGSPAYAVLAYSKNIGIGDLLFARRPAGTFAPTALSKLSDAEAYDKALAFLKAAGVPMSEVPRPPQGFLPVRSLAIGIPDDKGGSTRMTIQKVVTVPRAFMVSGGFPWLKDPRSGQALAHVIAPGKASIALNDAGVQFASVEGWSDAQLGRVDAKNAKSVAELADEITEDLWGEGVQKVASLSILISLRKGYPNPEDPDSPSCPVCGLLLPAVQVMVTPVSAGLLKQGTLVPPGVVREYDLVRPNEATATR